MGDLLAYWMMGDFQKKEEAVEEDERRGFPAQRVGGQLVRRISMFYRVDVVESRMQSMQVVISVGFRLAVLVSLLEKW